MSGCPSTGRSGTSCSILVSVNNGRRCGWELGGLRSHIVDVACCIYLAFDGLCTTCTGIEFIDRNVDS